MRCFVLANLDGDSVKSRAPRVNRPQRQINRSVALADRTHGKRHDPHHAALALGESVERLTATLAPRGVGHDLQRMVTSLDGALQGGRHQFLGRPRQSDDWASDGAAHGSRDVAHARGKIGAVGVHRIRADEPLIHPLAKRQ